MLCGVCPTATGRHAVPRELYKGLTRFATASHHDGCIKAEAVLNRRLAQTETQERARALASAVYVDCRSRCISDAGRRFLNAVLAALAEYEAITGWKYPRHGERATTFATAAEGFIGDLMLARVNTAANGWVWRHMHHKHFTGSEISVTYLDAVIDGLEFLGLIERAPHVRAFGSDLFVTGKMRSKGADARLRCTFKLTAMARDAGVPLDAVAKHFSRCGEAHSWSGQRDRRSAAR
jgi:hypothetical protein